MNNFFQTYPDKSVVLEDKEFSPTLPPINLHYTVFARYDSYDEYGCSSGRAVYVTHDKQDAFDVWDQMNKCDTALIAARWNNWEEPSSEEYWGVRRGCVTEYNSLQEAWASPEVGASDDIDWSDNCVQHAPSGPILAAWLRDSHPANVSLTEQPEGRDITPPHPVFQGPGLPPVQGPEQFFDWTFVA